MKTRHKFGAWNDSHAPPVSVRWQLGAVVHSPAFERQERHVSGLLDGCRHGALVLCAGTGLAARANAAFLCDVFSQKIDLFIVNRQGFVGAELAELRFCEKPAVTAAFAA